MGIFSKIAEKLGKTRKGFTEKIHEASSSDLPVDDDYLEFIEELLIESDFGVASARMVVEAIEQGVEDGSIKTRRDAGIKIREVILSILRKVEKPLEIRKSPFVMLVVGVNGSGKTTTIGKIASKYTDRGKKVMVVAGDTFRAAAIEQLEEWAKRAGASIVKQQENADPAAVVFDGIKSALSRRMDVVIIDTAGRLHTQSGLMREMVKIKRSINKAYGMDPDEVLLVLDATIGQNSINQARMFNKEIGITGIALTKMDGTAKGGIIVAISKEFGIPIRYIGIGEDVDDLKAFNARDFVEAVFVA